MLQISFMPKEHERNRIAWNEASAFYKTGLESSIDLLRKGGMTFFPPELKILEDLRSSMNTCIHLQCAAGTDSLSLINFGAKKVIGVDISEEMIGLAKEKSERLGMNADWICSDVLNVSQELNGVADLIYTGKGAINWMMDIKSWAKVASRLLKPGGFLYLFEGHPITYCFDIHADKLQMDPIYKGYFDEKPYESQGWPGTYVGKIKENESDQAKKFERAWPVSTVISALLESGFILKKFEEHPDKYWDEFLNLPDELRVRIPNTYSVVAQKPN